MKAVKSQGRIPGSNREVGGNMYDFRLWSDKDLLEVYAESESESWFQMLLAEEISKRGLDTRKALGARMVVSDLLRKVSPSSNIIICDEEILYYKGINSKTKISCPLRYVSHIYPTIREDEPYLAIVLEKE